MRNLMATIAVLALLAAPTLALQPDEILLLVNKNVPEGGRLAEYYRIARNLPQDRICSIPMPAADEVTFPFYEEQIVPAVRQFMQDRNLEKKIRCIVTFYGVPLRIGAHQPTPAERKEIADLQADIKAQLNSAKGVIEVIELEAKALDASFVPKAGTESADLELRARSAIALLIQNATADTDPPRRNARMQNIAAYVRELAGPAEVFRIFGNNPAPNEEAQKQNDAAREKLTQIMQEIGKLQHERWNPESRQKMRKLVGDVSGKLDLVNIEQVQIDYLKADAATNTEMTTAAFDSELALLWWDYYRRASWQTNTLFYGAIAAGAPPEAPGSGVIMTMRLDAPQSGEVRDIILASLKTEREGYKGKVVLDSRSIKDDTGKMGSYGWYDQSIRDLSEIIRTKTKLTLLHDESPGILPANSVNDVGLYCGWYSLRNYVPSCHFVPGAVGYHVASLEMVSLRGQGEKGWCRGLLDDGVASTLGAVYEPFLLAFPRADDFFPLLMTGKLPLAEVYWRTNLLTSWQVNMIGDPLYTPFQKNPAISVDDLPPRLKIVFAPPQAAVRPSTQPATRPAERMP